MLALLLACAGPDPGPANPPPYCDSGFAYHYAPDEALHTFPDDHWTVADSTTATGLRVSTPLDAPAFASFPEDYHNLLEQLGALDGFGMSAAMQMRFSQPVPALDVRLMVDDGGWRDHPITVETFDSGFQILVRPIGPLPPASRAVLAVHTDTPDGCIAPPPALRALLDPGSTEPLGDRYAEGLAALGWAPEEVGGMVVFTTQSLEVDSAVAADVAARDVMTSGFTCVDEGTWRDCRGTLTVADYRVDGVVPEEPVAARSMYELPVAVWLPPGAGPFPVTLCGHGLGGSKDQCRFMAELGAGDGVATIAVDAQEHGEHPLRHDGSDLEQIMALFGFTLTPPTLDTRVLRDNFRASAWDKLQVVRAIGQGLDVDGDGAADLDATRLTYAGASLGGIMGPELLAWAPEVKGAALVVPGGGLIDLVVQSATFNIVAAALTPPEWDEDDLQRALPMVQTLIDAGDPLVHAAEITRRRADAEQLDVALLMAVDDVIIPNSATGALAQAFGVPGVGTEFVAFAGITFESGPVSGNLGDGASGALLEYAETHPWAGAEAEAADHSTLHESEEAAAVLLPFLLDVNAGRTPTLTGG
jgi:dienelactone hydrolase